jgi:hypothetical protein
MSHCLALGHRHDNDVISWYIMQLVEPTFKGSKLNPSCT